MAATTVMERNTDRAGDLEVEDDGPDQAQRQLGVPICNVIVPDVHQLDLRRQSNTTNTQRRQFVLAEDFDRAFQLVVVVVFGSRQEESHTWRCLRKSSAICTFCSLWKRMRPFSLGCRVEMKRLDMHTHHVVPSENILAGLE